MPVHKQRLDEKLRVLLSLLFVFLPLVTWGQQAGTQDRAKKKIELIWSDLLLIDNRDGIDLRRLIGKVTLRHNEMLMMCDSAHLFPDKNEVKAYSRVHIQQGDTLDIYGDYLFYSGSEEKARLEGKVELVDKETHLFTPAIDYDVKSKVANYSQKGRITNGDNVLTSDIGIYVVDEKLFYFRDSVKIVNPDYVMKADTMKYNTETETAYFIGPSELEGDSIYIYCEQGWYDTKKDVSSLWKNSFIDNRQQQIKGDSLFYDKTTGYGKAWRNISITDTTNNVVVTGEYASYSKDPESFLVTEKAVFMQYSSDDSLYLHADTISAVTRTDSLGKSFRLMRAFYGCRIFSRGLQSKCDSLSYSFQDSVIRMYKSPVIWSEENQLTADSVAIFTKNRQAERMELYNSAFVASQVDSTRFNQMKGRNLTGYFRDNKLIKVVITGNGETIYFIVDNDKLLGVNHTKSSSIEILVDNGKITDIIEYQNPDGKTDPPLLNPPAKLKLQGFIWSDFLRPKDRFDIFRK